MQEFTCFSILRAKGWPHWTTDGEPHCAWPSSPRPCVALSVTVGHLWADAESAAQKLHSPASLKPWHFFTEVSVGMRNQVTGMPQLPRSRRRAAVITCVLICCCFLALLTSLSSEFFATGPNSWFLWPSLTSTGFCAFCACLLWWL